VPARVATENKVVYEVAVDACHSGFGSHGAGLRSAW
jgi:hypothetical protein